MKRHAVLVTLCFVFGVIALYLAHVKNDTSLALAGGLCLGVFLRELIALTDTSDIPYNSEDEDDEEDEQDEHDADLQDQTEPQGK